jgi:hypothetical protein
MEMSRNQPTRWPAEDKDKIEGYIAAWDAAHDWLEEIRAEHFPKVEGEETVSEKPVAWVPPGLETTWTVTMTNTNSTLSGVSMEQQ